MVVVRPSFKASDGGGVSARLPSWLRSLLAHQFAELGAFLGADSASTERSAPRDPLEVLTGMSDHLGTPPDDPVLRRLRPDAYAPDVEDGIAASDFRRFTESDLAALQRQRVTSVRETLGAGDRFELDAEQAQEWLGALNDLRLALGTRLEVTDDPDDAPAKGDPRAAAYEVYGLLGHLQHLLLVALGAPDEY
jgi:hypothetical protein